RARVIEELDYSLEAEAQRTFAAAYADDPEIRVARVVASAPKVLVSEWLDGTPMSAIIAGGSGEQRDPARYLLSMLNFSAPARARLLHADPHPGNFRLLPDGRLGVVDFGAVARLPDGLPRTLGRITRLALEGRAREALAELRADGFIKPGIRLDPQRVLDYLQPMLDPLRADTFRFTREWMRRQAARIGDLRSEPAQIARQLNLPPAYLLIHRVTLGSIGVLCQLNAEAAYRPIVERWQPGVAD